MAAGNQNYRMPLSAQTDRITLKQKRKYLHTSGNQRGIILDRPLLRAEGIIVRKDGLAVLVQCDSEESFYRFPGGGVEFGEAAAEAIKRELIEEFDLQAEIGALACLNESIVEYDG